MRRRIAVFVATLCICQLVVAASTSSAAGPSGTANGKGKASPTLTLKTLVATGGDVVAVFAFSLLFALCCPFWLGACLMQRRKVQKLKMRLDQAEMGPPMTMPMAQQTQAPVSQAAPGQPDVHPFHMPRGGPSDPGLIPPPPAPSAPHGAQPITRSNSTAKSNGTGSYGPRHSTYHEEPYYEDETEDERPVPRRQTSATRHTSARRTVEPSGRGRRYADDDDDERY